ncbi:MAG: hypothetical protein KC589_05815 [Nanoarchaeota archaeon]|nr:hypothetical protein [Nanoarchaeota archaeon]
MRKKVNFLRHFAVLFLTVIIFVVGILIGGEVEDLRVTNLYTDLQKQDLNYQNIVTEGNYIDYLVSLKEEGENVSCDLVKGAYYTSISNLDDSRLKLEAYINNAKVNEEEYQRLKNHYSNLQINYWILANRINNLCDNSMNPILYFYGDKKKCPACEDQGTHLSYVKAKIKDDVLIFSLDAEKEGPISLLAQKYDVSGRELPVLVIDEKVYGFTKNEAVFDILCDAGYVGKVCNE